MNYILRIALFNENNEGKNKGTSSRRILLMENSNKAKFRILHDFRYTDDID